MIEIVEILDRCDFQRGVLQPFICRGSDNKLYYVKGSNSTARGQIAEWVATNLALCFGLPSPHCDIAVIAPELAELTSPQWQQDLRFEYCFASESVEPCQTLSFSMAKRVEKQLQCDVLLFDYWVCNGDRNLSGMGGNVNLLVTGEGNNLQVIDFNLAFDRTFTAQDLHHHVFWTNKGQSLPDLVDRLSYENRFRSTLSNFDTIVSALPQEWLENLSEPLDYIEYLRETLERFAQPKFWEELS